MSLETMRPNPTWDPAAYEEAIEVLAAHRDELVYRVWGGDWCKDCRRLLPDFGAALDAAEIPDDRIEEIAVDEDKRGPGVEEYDIEYIPTIVVERVPAGTERVPAGTGRAPVDAEEAGKEVTRFVEEEDRPPAVWLAEEIEARLESA